MSFNPGSAGYESTGNSTTTPLSASASFEGVAEQNPRGEILVQVFADVPGTLFIEFSVDGTNWDVTLPENGFAVKANIAREHRAVCGFRYVRVRFVNGSTNQTTFRLSTYFGTFGHLNSPLNEPYSLDSDSQLVRPTLTWLDIARGLTTGLTTEKVAGRNTAIGTSFAPITRGGIYRTPQSGSATALRIKAGGNANDDAAGSGARQITLVGLDENFEEVTETLATAGTSASSSTTNTFTRLLSATVSQSGGYADTSNGSHAGTITIEDSAGTQEWATIGATGYPKGSTEIGFYTVPAGKTAYVKVKRISIDSGKTADILFLCREGADETAAPYTPMKTEGVITGVAGGSVESFGDTEIPFGPFTGPADVGFMAKVASSTATVSVAYEVFLIEA